MSGGDASAASLAELYRNVVLTHAANPVGYNANIEATHSAQGSNPLCGDHVTLELQIAGGQVMAAAFSGESCAICTASVSLLCDQLPGRAVEEIRAIVSGFEQALAHHRDANCPEFMHAMLGVAQYPARVQCALLPWRTAEDAINV